MDWSDLGVRTLAWIVLHSPLRWTMHGLTQRQHRWREEIARDLLEPGSRVLLGNGVLGTHLCPDLGGAVCGMPVRSVTGGTIHEVTCRGCRRFLRSVVGAPR